MVAAGDDVGPGFEKLAADLVGDTEAGGRVLAVHDDEVEAEALAQPREMRRNSIAARPADHIPAEQNSHEPYAFLDGCAPPLGAAPASVTTRSSGWSRSDERRGGKECVSTCRSRWSQYHYTNKTKTTRRSKMNAMC